MIKIEYYIGSKLIETHYKPTMILANYLKNVLIKTHKTGKLITIKC